MLTGGPCAGKTEVWRSLEGAFPGVARVPEAATDLILAGESPESLGLEAFQRRVLERQQELEDRAGRTARRMVCDRGMADGAAYLPSLFDRLGVSAAGVLARYERVVQLAVIEDPDTYALHRGVNPARSEPHAEALRLEEALRRVYGVHPGYVFVRGSLAEKIRRVREILDAWAR